MYDFIGALGKKAGTLWNLGGTRDKVQRNLPELTLFRKKTNFNQTF
jgi:hypothetical protein